VIVREAAGIDWPALAEFLLKTPLDAGAAFVLDRRPDFCALPRLRGEFRSFVALRDGRIAGTVTALWHPARDGERTLLVGEIIDLRVAPWARHGCATIRLLRAAHAALLEQRVDWVVSLIGHQNQAAISLVGHRAGLPLLVPLDEVASVHFMAWKVAPARGIPAVHVRKACASDAALLGEFCATALAAERFAPVESLIWPDPTGLHQAWIAFDSRGRPSGALVLWDGETARRIRVLRYRSADLPVRLLAGALAQFGRAAPFPAPGEALGVWASRLVSIRHGGAATLRALLDAALSCAAFAGRNVVQLNLHRDDPLRRSLPMYPRSTYWSTLYGAPFRGAAAPPPTNLVRHHVDVAFA
jgi:hypothetical protein